MYLAQQIIGIGKVGPRYPKIDFDVGGQVADRRLQRLVMVGGFCESDDSNKYAVVRNLNNMTRR